MTFDQLRLFVERVRNSSRDFLSSHDLELRKNAAAQRFELVGTKAKSLPTISIVAGKAQREPLASELWSPTRWLTELDIRRWMTERTLALPDAVIRPDQLNARNGE